VGAAGAGAAGATASGGMSGMPNATPSGGCTKQMPAEQVLAQYTKYSEMVPASAVTKGNWLMPRTYWVWLPSNYDNKHAYPTVFVGPGCGGTGDKAIQMQVASGNDAIIVGLDYNATATGRSCFNTETFPDPEVEFVENTVKLVEDAYCVDKSRLFIEGFSSGSWLSYLMGCVDGGPGGLFKGQGNASGEMQGVPANACKGPIAYMAGHNNPDGNNAYPGGRDHMIKMNGCTMPPQTMPYDPGPMVKPPKAGVTIDCVQYMGCMAPTVFCTTTGIGHDPQEQTGISTYGFWKFWMALP
jgi:poly(3-hydroxybutyrate) depolymerase